MLSQSKDIRTQLLSEYLEKKLQRKEFNGYFPSSTQKEKIFFKRSVPAEATSSEEMINLYIIHGATEYHQRQSNLPEFLIKKNSSLYNINWLDFKGHGLSSGSRGHVDSFSEYEDDLLNFLNLNFLNEGKNTAKNYLVAHSMGGLVCLKLLLEKGPQLKRQISGIILANPCIKPQIKKTPFVLQTAKLLNNLGSFGKKLKFKNTTKGIELTSDVVQAKNYDTDPLILKELSLGYLHEIIQASLEIRSLAYYIDIPCLFLFSGRDSVVDNQSGELFAKGIQENLRQIQIYPESQHDLFNDLGREKVFHDVHQWLIKKSLV